LEENKDNLAFVPSLTVWEGEINVSKPFLFTAKFCKNKNENQNTFKLNSISINLKYKPSHLSMLSSGLFPNVCSLNASISEHCLLHLHKQVGMKCDCGSEYGV
jgi:hypothetical protein